MFARKNKGWLRLSFQGKVVREVPLADVKDGFTLGRGSSCDWTFPAEDRLVSTKHAAIECRRGQYTLVDAGSKNGMYAGGERVERCRLEPGVIVNLGQCELAVADPAVKQGAGVPARTAKADYHRLEPLNRPPKTEIALRGELLRGKDWIEVKEPEFKAGSDPGCELHIRDPHVSRVHAVFSQDEHGFFFTPSKTTNPSCVNREQATPGVKRMLRDGDIVSLAFYEFRFLDKHVKHTRSFFWLKVTAAVVTLVVLFSAYFAYQWGTASSDELLQRARLLAAEERFAEARAALEEAAHARGSGQYQQQRNELADRLAVWERTAVDWEGVRAAFTGRNWSDAVRRLSLLRVERIENWNWNETATLAVRQQALVAKNALDVFVAGGVMTNAPDRKVEAVVALRDRLTVLLDDKALKTDPLFEVFLQNAARVRDTLASDLAWNQRYERALAQLDSRGVDFPGLIGELEAVASNATEWVSRRVPGVLEPVKKLQEVNTGLRANMRAVHGLAFSDVVKTLPWPTPDECSVHPNLGIQRAYLEKSNNAILESARQVEAQMDTFRRLGVQPPQTPDVIARALDAARWDGVFACGVLAKKIPNRMRQEPVDDYDRMLGIESFYEMLFKMPEKSGEEAMDTLAFTPELVTARKFFTQFQVFLDYVKKDAWLVQSEGVLAQTAAFCERMLEEREKLVARLFRAGDMASAPRRSLIGRGVALYLAPDGMYEGSARVRLADDFKSFRASVQKLGQTYDSVEPEEKIRVRDQILAEGFPGDPVVRRMWAQRE